MNWDALFEYSLYGWTVGFVAFAAVAALLVLLFVPAPYGRHAREGWGPEMPARWGWFVMEGIAPVAFGAVFLAHRAEAGMASWVVGGLYVGHYVYRGWIYPFRMRAPDKRMPVVTVVLAVLFNLCNAPLNAFALAALGSHLDSAWFASPLFWGGLALFAAGLVVNHHSDAILRRLREPGESGYAIPEGGLYRWISCPNYFGEMVEWTGFALAAMTIPGWLFVVFTAANLVPRAVAHHRWYREHFDNYPEERRAIFPFLL